MRGLKSMASTVHLFHYSIYHNLFLKKNGYFKIALRRYLFYLEEDMIKLINMVKGQLSKGKNVILTFGKRICVLQILGCNGDTASVKYDHGDNIDTITGANKAIYKVDIKDIMMYICRCNYSFFCCKPKCIPLIL